MGLIIYRSLTANIMIWQFSLGSSYTNIDRPFYSSRGEVIAFSFTKPLVIL